MALETGIIREVSMIIHVQYQNYHYDFVDVETFERLLTEKEIRGFYRASERRWVDISSDHLRGTEGNYSGPERRHKHY